MPTVQKPSIYANDPQVLAALSRLDGQFAGVYAWAAQLYDPKSGGFFESLAARDDPRFGPDIQSTAMMIRLINETGLLATMPDDIKRGLVNYFQSRQEPNGFFFDPDYPQFRRDERTRTRMLGMTASALTTLGAQPRYPLPGENTDADATDTDAMAAHIQSKEAWMKWFKTKIGPRPGYWGDGTGEMDLLTSQTGLVKSLPEARRVEIARATRDYLAQSQDPRTGLWNGSVHAALKLSSFLRGQGISYPRPREVYASTMGWYRQYDPEKSYPLRSMGPADTPRLGNPIRLLVNLEDEMGHPISRADLLEVLAYYQRALPRFKQADGAFSRHDKKFEIVPLDRRVASAPGPQSDVNGTHNVRGIRTAAYQLAGLEAPPLPGADKFYDLLRQRIQTEQQEIQP